MSVLNLIADLRASDIKLYLEDGKLRVNAPKGAMTSELLERVKAEKAAITSFLQEIGQGHDSRLGERLRIPRRPDGAPVLASFAQQRLWFLDQLEGPSATYNMPAALRFRGALDVAAMRGALVQMVRRHEILRTRFEAVNGEPRLSIVDQLDVPLLVKDVAEHEVMDIAGQHARHHFDLSVAPLIITDLLRIGASEHVLLVNIHHIICDGWSLGVLVDEWVRLYAAHREVAPLPLAPLQIQYADYAHWQRHVLQGALLDQQLEYWKRKLAGAPELLNLPTDRPRPPVQRFEGGRQELVVDLQTLQQLRRLGHEAGASMFMLLLSAFGLLMSRYSGEDDVLVGTPFVNRDRQELEGLIGLFLHSLVLRVDLSGQPRFRELVERVRQTALEAYANSDVPFERIVDALPLQRDLSRNPLFQVFFNMLNLPEGSNQLPELEVEGLQGLHFDAKFDLTLYAQENAQGLRLNLAYNATLFDAERMRELLAQYRLLLEQIVAAPDAVIDHFDLLTEEAKLLLPDPAVTLDRTWRGAVHEMFIEQAARRPDALAVVAHDLRWSYRELHDYSERIACHLQSQGVVADDVVVIFATRSAALAAAVLGVLKAGAIYSILDPAYPAAHLQACIEAAAPRAWLQVSDQAPDPSTRQLRDTVPVVLDLQRVSDHPQLSEFAGQSARRVPRSAEDIALIAFTSGSSGKPKAVESRHGPLTHYLPWVVDTFGLDEQDRISMLSGLAHDPLQRDMFTAFCLGASLHVPDAEDIAAGKILAWMDDQRISVSNLTPAMAQLLCEDASDANLPHLQHAFLVGDVLTRRDVNRLQAVAPAVRIVSYYGATETQRAFGYYDLLAHADLHPAREVIPLGHGIGGVQLLVLNAKGRLAGIGEHGEIHMRSPHLARGYRHDPELTAQKFLPNPYSDLVGDRIYRTGDLGRYLPNGMVEGLGRADTQVKLRGFRVELGHVESVLGQHPQVREAIVSVGSDAAIGRYLVAYVVHAQEAVSAAKLREFLRGRLPDYMQPSSYVFLDQLPLTPNGKVDRRALPEPAAFVNGKAYVAPASNMEYALCEIWRDVLKRDEVSCADNFFEIGGHSLLATQLVSRLRKRLGIELSLRQLFDTPVLSDLAAHLQASTATTTQGEITRRSDDAPAPLSFAQQRLWFLSELEGPSATYNMPAALRLRGELDVDALRRSVQTIVDRHDSLRTTFAQVEGQAVQMVLPRYAVDIAIVAAHPDEVDAATTRHALHRFDLKRGPLFDIRLLRIAADDHVLLLNTHHIISDAWSVGVLVAEFSDLYTAYRQGLPGPLADLPIQYGDYASWQRQWMQGAELERLANYWREQLLGIPPLLPLPTDRPRPSLQTFAGAQHRFRVDADVAAALVTLAQRQGATLFMTLLAAYQILLARYSGQDDIAVGTPIANRTRSELEPLIGFFVNTLVLRSRVDLALNFEELLAQVRATTLAAYEHQHFPFEQLVDLLKPERNLSHSPLFQVMFVMQNQSLEDRRLPGLDLSALVNPRTVAKFDLTLTMVDSADGIAGTFEYNTDLFDADTIARLQMHFCHLLRSLSTQPALPMAHQAMLNEAETEHLLLLGRGRDSNEHGGRFVHALIAQHAADRPDAVAVDDGQAALSYAALDQRANCLAHYLRAAQVGPESVVGVCFDGSLEMIVAILAVFKAGGAYLPLDPVWPDRRLANAITDADVWLVLTQASQLHRDGLQQARRFAVDRDWAQVDAMPASAPLVDSHPDNLAYLIYTSGSTGKPKGVQVSHRGLCNLALEFAAGLGVSPHSRFVQFASSGFDAAVVEIFATLCAGAALCVVEREGRMPGKEFVSWLNEQRIDCAILSPSVLAQLSPQDLPDLATLVSAGEACSADIQARWTPGRRFINAYGPSETTVCASMAACELAQREVSIGRPIANFELLVLDSQGMLLPSGVAGELHIGGIGLARGYRDQPTLTAERFVPHPYARHAGERLYRSGDLVRQRKDGSLEFLGRTDQQVKLRGFRIELGEIEHALTAQECVGETVVLLREDLVGEKRLVAYATARDGASIDVPMLRERLGESLPAYMLPAAIVVMQRMPLTTNGKVDRKALPAPDFTSPQRTYLAPRNAVETRLAAIWQATLNLPQVSINDNFFEIGGHSLLTILLMSRIGAEFGVELPVRTIFAMPTIASMAAQLGAGGPGDWSPLVPMQAGRTGSVPLFLVHPQGGSVLLYADLVRALGSDQGVYGLQALGLEAGQTPLETVEAMASLYVAAMRQVQARGPYRLAGYSLGGTIALEVARQLISSGEEVAFLGLIDTAAPMQTRSSEFSRAYLLAGVWGYTLGFSESELNAMDEKQQVEFVLSRAIAAGSVPADYGPDDAERLIRVIETCSRAVARYWAEDYAGAAVLFKARDHERPANLQRWRSLLGERLSVIDVPGDHLNLIMPPHALTLAASIVEQLEAAEQASKTRTPHAVTGTRTDPATA